MTAEIAILNRTAVALAADSIVTLSGTSGSKTYDSAEKIFELSRFRPIGLMVYNNAELIRIPVEILVREFREEISDQFTHLLDVWPCFKRFILKICSNSEFDDSTTEYRALIDNELGNLKLAFVNAAMKRSDSGGKKTPTEINENLVKLIDLAVDVARYNQLPGFMENITQDQFTERYGEITREHVNKKMAPLVQSITGEEMGDELWDKFNQLGFVLVRSRKKSSAFTGIVFAGFGRNDRFSSLQSVEIDGIYFDQVRVINTKDVDIDRHGETAAIVPFAQKDMPERFIFGIDQDFEERLKKIAEELATQVLSQASNSFNPQQVEEIKTAAIKRFTESIEIQKEQASRELNSVVNHLSKKELGEVAYSLVELTSRKRRYSRQMETVGGPIDVAILTRNEGFVWVRRKRYFDVELNPAYIERLKQKMQHPGVHDE